MANLTYENSGGAEESVENIRRCLEWAICWRLCFICNFAVRRWRGEGDAASYVLRSKKERICEQ